MDTFQRVFHIRIKIANLLLGSLLIFLFALGFSIFAWTEPNLPPPQGTIAIPITTSSTAQGKLGNLGIGLSVPLSRLHIQGGQPWGSDISIDATGPLGGSRWLLVSTGGTASEGLGKFLIKDAGQVRLIIDTAGNVGIGTTSPTAKLEVAGQIKITGGIPGAKKVLTSDAAGLASWQALVGGTVTSISQGSGLTFSANPITTTGTISLNTTSISTCTNTTTNKIIWDSTNKRLNCATDQGLTGSGTVNYLAKFTSATTLANSKIFDNGTNIGIGTASPSQKLDLVGNLKLNSNQAIQMRLENTANLYSSLACSNANRGYIYYDTALGKVCVCLQAGWNCTAQPVSGTGPRKVFLTKARGTGNLGSWSLSGGIGGINGANNICQKSAEKAGLSTSAGPKIFRAWISDDNIDAIANMGCSDLKSYVLTNGSIIADNCSDLTDGEIDNPINAYEDGTSATDTVPYVFTYTLFSGVSGSADYSGDCMGWTSTDGHAGVGSHILTGEFGWTGYRLPGHVLLCSGEYHLYCFEY